MNIEPITYITPKGDPQKDEAQKMATDLETLENLFAELKSDPSLADEPMFWSQITTAVEAIGTEYNYLLTTGIIPESELSQMFGTFNLDVLGLKISPGSAKTFLFVCNEADQGQTDDLHQFLDSLKDQPGVFNILIKDTTNAENLFQAYANSH